MTNSSFRSFAMSSVFMAACLAATVPSSAFDPASETPFFPEGEPLEGLVITLDPGHGGSSFDQGYSGSARGTSSRVVEGDLNMLVAAQARWHLIHGGAKVHMTRWDDRRVTLNPEEGEPTGRSDELGARVRVATETRSHLFLSLHHNSAPRETADGVVVLIWPTDSEGNEQPLEIAFADALEEEVRQVVHNTEDFGHYLNEHPLVTYSDMPSAVIEFGFLSSPEFDAWVSQQGTHRAEAVGIYNAVVKMWTEHREELGAERERLFPKVASDEPASRPAKASPSSAFDSLARQLWPAGPPVETAEEAEWLLDNYKARHLPDRTSFLFDVDVERTEAGWFVRGMAGHERVEKAAVRLLEAAGAKPVTAEFSPVPAQRLGDKAYGVVQIPMALTWSSPGENTGVQTQLMLGEPVFLIDESEDGDYLRLHGPEGYIGWVRREAIRRMTADEFEAWNAEPKVTVRTDTLVDDFRIPAGARLPLIEAAEAVKVRLPMGVRTTEGALEAELPSEAVLPPPGRTVGEAALEAAREFLGVPYVFGGRSRLGLDCSGLMRTAYASAGMTLPRDAWQQADVGQLVATSWYRRGLEPGDLVYFLDETGRVFHTGISLGGSRFMHSSPPEVQINSMDPGDPLYSEHWTERFAFARRPGGMPAANR